MFSTVSHSRGQTDRKWREEEGFVVVRHVGKLCNKELLAKQRTNVFSKQSPWWYLLCHTTRLPDTGEIYWQDAGSRQHLPQTSTQFITTFANSIHNHLLPSQKEAPNPTEWLELRSLREIIVFICFQCVITQINEVCCLNGKQMARLIPHTGRWHRVSSQLKATSGSLYPTSSIRLIFQMSSWSRSNGRQATERSGGVSSAAPLSVCRSAAY